MLPGCLKVNGRATSGLQPRRYLSLAGRYLLGETEFSSARIGGSITCHYNRTTLLRACTDHEGTKVMIMIGKKQSSLHYLYRTLVMQRLWEQQLCPRHSHSFIHPFSHPFSHPFISPSIHPFIHLETPHRESSCSLSRSEIHIRDLSRPVLAIQKEVISA